MVAAVLQAQLAPRGVLLPGVLHGAAPPQQASDDLAGNNSGPAQPVKCPPPSLERISLINFYDTVLIRSRILI